MENVIVVSKGVVCASPTPARLVTLDRIAISVSQLVTTLFAETTQTASRSTAPTSVCVSLGIQEMANTVQCIVYHTPHSCYHIISLYPLICIHTSVVTHTLCEQKIGNEEKRKGEERKSGCPSPPYMVPPVAMYAINPCASNGHGCHKNAACHFKGPGKHSCTCVEGYTGDGTVCTVIDPCQTSNGGCPSNSSVCNFLGPNKGNCSCLPGFENFQDGAGCSMVDLCKGGGGCDINANCIMPSPGQKMCICKDGFRGNFNNTHCYGSIIQRLEDLNDAGPAEVRSKLTIARRLVAALAWPLAGSGPFTALVPTDQGFLKSLSQAKIDETLSSPDLSGYLARLHIIASDLDSVKLKALGTVTTLQGTNATITEKNGTLYFSGSGQDAMARIIMTDLIAGNGLIHILDTAMKYPANFSSSSDMSVLDVIQSSNELSTLSSLLQLSGVGSTLVGLSLPVTIFAPVNAAFSSVDNVTIRYLTTTQQGKQKLSMLLKNHIFDTKINVEDLITMNRITSSTEESSLVSLKQQGLLVLGRNSRLISANLGARDGVLHMVDHVIVPDSLMPLVPRYCNIITNQTSRGRCYHCQLIDKFPNRGCESDTIPSVSIPCDVGHCRNKRRKAFKRLVKDFLMAWSSYTKPKCLPLHFKRTHNPSLRNTGPQSPTLL
ncbi:predicted protein [Nematostella vectensis]|uniref:Stabilin 2 n=1 Tax=Nematostella vectensis TaxID=45351 RepID=A7S9Z5_NEMVE|nr:predicted protein [Nematostella vectensis]|eukprot:XP_001631533.1 predicted protein [Nematostella vectensis]